MKFLRWSAAVVLVSGALALSSMPGNAATTHVKTYPPVTGPLSMADGAGRDDIRLYGVSALAPDDVWVVGARYGDSRVRSLIQHWDGSTWRSIPTPPMGDDDVLEAVSAVAADDVWAVGSYDDPQSSSIALVEHWDGTRWRVDRSLPTYREVGLTGVSGVSSSQMFAVGYGLGGQFESIQQAVTLHVHGDTHTLHRQVSPAGYVQELNSVSMRSATAGWAVGTSFAKFGKPGLAFAQHWNGHAWVQVEPIEAGSRHTTLTGVDVAGKADVWAVGSRSNGRTGPTYKLIEHFAAGHWSVVKTPNLHARYSFLSAVSSDGSDDAWAVGVRVADGSEGPFALHWDGTAWWAVDMPPGATTPDVVSVTDVPGATWAVGVDFVDDEHLGVIRDFWNGRAWVAR